MPENKLVGRFLLAVMQYTTRTIQLLIQANRSTDPQERFKGLCDAYDRLLVATLAAREAVIQAIIEAPPTEALNTSLAFWQQESLDASAEAQVLVSQCLLVAARQVPNAALELQLFTALQREFIGTNVALGSVKVLLGFEESPETETRLLLEELFKPRD